MLMLMKKPANNHKAAKRLLSLTMVVALVMWGASGSFLGVSAALGNCVLAYPVNEQVYQVSFENAIDAMVALDNYYAANGEAREKVLLTIDESTSFPIDCVSYVRLAAAMLEAIEAGDTGGTIAVVSGIMPLDPGRDSYAPSMVPKADYLKVAADQKAHMEENQSLAANFIPLSGGEFSFKRTAVVLPRVLAYYKYKGTLPESVDASYEGKGEKLVLKNGAGLEIDEQKGFVLGIAPRTNAEDVMKNFISGNIKIFEADGATEAANDARVGTGYVIKLFDGNNRELHCLILVVSKDVSGDSLADARDIGDIQKHMLQQVLLEGGKFAAGDANADGMVNGRDIGAVQSYMLGS